MYRQTYSLIQRYKDRYRQIHRQTYSLIQRHTERFKVRKNVKQSSKKKKDWNNNFLHIFFISNRREIIKRQNMKIQDFWKNLEDEWREMAGDDNHPWIQVLFNLVLDFFCLLLIFFLNTFLFLFSFFFSDLFLHWKFVFGFFICQTFCLDFFVKFSPFIFNPMIFFLLCSFSFLIISYFFFLVKINEINWHV